MTHFVCMCAIRQRRDILARNGLVIMYTSQKYQEEYDKPRHLQFMFYEAFQWTCYTGK